MKSDAQSIEKWRKKEDICWMKWEAEEMKQKERQNKSKEYMQKTYTPLNLCFGLIRKGQTDLFIMS